MSKKLIQESQIILISGQLLVDFVLGRRLKIEGATICVDCTRSIVKGEVDRV